MCGCMNSKLTFSLRSIEVTVVVITTIAISNSYIIIVCSIIMTIVFINNNIIIVIIVFVFVVAVVHLVFNELNDVLQTEKGGTSATRDVICFCDVMVVFVLDCVIVVVVFAFFHVFDWFYDGVFVVVDLIVVFFLLFTFVFFFILYRGDPLREG